MLGPFTDVERRRVIETFPFPRVRSEKFQALRRPTSLSSLANVPRQLRATARPSRETACLLSARLHLARYKRATTRFVTKDELYLRESSQTARRSGLYFNPEKCTFHSTSLVRPIDCIVVRSSYSLLFYLLQMIYSTNNLVLKDDKKTIQTDQSRLTPWIFLARVQVELPARLNFQLDYGGVYLEYIVCECFANANTITSSLILGESLGSWFSLSLSLFVTVSYLIDCSFPLSLLKATVLPCVCYDIV